MKKITFFLLLAIPFYSTAQFGVKAGLNFANVSNTSSINNNSETGFNVGIFLAPKSKGLISSKTELILSKQGYNYTTGAVNGTADLLYIMLPSYICFNITRLFQLHIGAQAAYLINAKADSSNSSGSTDPISDVTKYYNRFDYGYGGGAEVRPISNLIVGVRINISLAKLYSDALSGQAPSLSSVDVKQNLFQIYAGWHFGLFSGNCTILAGFLGFI